MKEGESIDDTHYTLTCALSMNEYNKICRLKTTKEIWDSLSINYEGTKNVQVRKTATLTRHYESFSMKEGESIDDTHYTLTFALPRNEYNKICRLKTTKEIWDSLSINYEGTKDV